MATSSPPTTLDRDTGTAAPSVALTVLVADKFDQAGLEQMEALGCRVQFDADLTADTLPAAVTEHDPDVLIVRSTMVLAAAVEAAAKLSLIVRAGAGYDTIDVAAAAAKGIFVANCPGMNAIAVAELAWALILACDRRVPDQCADVRSGTWNKKEYVKKAAGLHGRSFLALLEGRACGPNGAVFAEKTFHDCYDPMRCIRTERYKYIRYFEKSTIMRVPGDAMSGGAFREFDPKGFKRYDEELFDLESDPDEMNNLAREPGLAIDGEFQADSAIVPRVAAKKVRDASAVAQKPSRTRGPPVPALIGSSPP